MKVTVYKKSWEDGVEHENAPSIPDMIAEYDGDVVCYRNIELLDGTSDTFWLYYRDEGNLKSVRLSLKYWTVSTVTPF